MLVLIGPEFEGTQEAYERLARVTGLVSYDLRARVRAQVWGVVKVLADEQQAIQLAEQLTSAGFRPVLIDRGVANDPERRIVHARQVALRETDFVLSLGERDMPIEYAAVCCIVRGEVLPGRTAQRAAGGPSSATMRAASATEPVSSRDATVSTFEAYQAADVHFLSVPWIARLDSHSLGGSTHEASPRALDALVDELARRANARLDRNVRTSSVASLAEQSVPMRSLTSEPPGIRELRKEQADDRFDSYSRIIGQAERLLRG